MTKFLSILGVTAATLIMSAGTANAATPDGQFNFKDNGAGSNASLIGQQSSAINQNGQFVSGQDNAYGIDQTTAPGSRAALVQAALGH